MSGNQERESGFGASLETTLLKQGVRFSAYAYQAIMRYVWGDVKSEQRRKKREAPICELALFSYETGRDPAWIKDQQVIGESLQELMERLLGRLRQVIEGYYGFYLLPTSLNKAQKRLDL